jgi:membrane protease YdiL (CAAX protease family)
MKIIRRYPLVSFFVLAYTITWSLQLTGIFLAADQGMKLSNETNFLYFIDLISLRLSSSQALVYFVFSLGAGPLVSAIVVTWIIEGKAGLTRLWQQSTKWKVEAKWYLIVLALPLVLSAVSLGLGLLTTGFHINYNLKLPVQYFVPFLLYMLVFTGIAEEPGWRGFALPRLQSRFNAENASWVLGILWGVWHFPFMIYYYYSAGIVPLLVSLLGLTFGIVGWTTVNTWIYNNTRSTWLAILLHGWGNAVQSYLILSSDNMAAQTLYGFLPWVLVLILFRVYGKENLSRQPRPQE